MKTIKLYKEWMESGEITNEDTLFPPNGLCYSSLGSDGDFKYFFSDPINHKETGYWAHGNQNNVGSYSQEAEFTPLRQNIVLLLAALKGEL